jgi:aminopeptidase N
MSQPGGSTYIPPEEIAYDNVWRIFDGRLSYNKGAAILHMIRFELQDDDVFFQVLHDYTGQYSGSTATGLDFMNVLNDVSGMDFTDFFDQWYFGEGYPTYSIVWSQNNGGLFMEVTQTTSKPSVTPMFTNKMAYKFHFYEGGDTTVYVHQTENVESFSFPITKEVGLIQIDPDNWVVNQTGSIVTNAEKHSGSLNFSYSPNPANNKLNIEFESALKEEITLQIIDNQGRIIKNFSRTTLRFLKG